MQLQYSTLTAALLTAGTLASPILANANDASELEELRSLVQALDQKVKVLSRKEEISTETLTTDKKISPLVKADSNGFSLISADGRNEIKFRGLVQADHRHFSDGANDVRNRSRDRAGLLDGDGFNHADDSSLLRRVRPTIEGRVAGIYGFRFTPEFGGGSASVVDAYVDVNLNPTFNVRAGKFKSFVGLERLQGGGDIKFIERSYVTNAILPNRDLGIALYGDVLDKKLNYAVAIVNGVADGGNISTGTEYNGEREYTARLFTTPFKNTDSALAGLGFGIGGTYTNFTGEQNLNFTDTTAADATRNGLPSYVTDGQQTFFRYGANTIADGNRTRISPQASYYYGAFGMIAEYARVNQDVSLIGNSAGTTTNNALPFLSGTKRTLSHDAWELAGTYLLTGEDASFKGVKPKNDFDIDKGSWGAWEIVARYSEINLDSDTFKNRLGNLAGENLSTNTSNSAFADASKSAKSAKTWTAGINWYLNANAKVALNYSHTAFEGGAISGNGQNGAAGDVGRQVKNRANEDAILARLQLVF